jgi:hypothetical protein
MGRSSATVRRCSLEGQEGSHSDRVAQEGAYGRLSEGQPKRQDRSVSWLSEPDPSRTLASRGQLGSNELDQDLKLRLKMTQVGRSHLPAPTVAVRHSAQAITAQFKPRL